MTVFVDQRMKHYSGGYWCHLVSDTSLEELHAFAERLGLKREWFQDHRHMPHYDLKGSAKWEEAIRLGAQAISTRAMIRLISRGLPSQPSRT